MPSPPAFASLDDHLSSLSDPRYWQPYVYEILSRHGLAHHGGEPVCGFNPTNPTFLCGDFVVKVFGYSGFWRRAYEAERAAHALLATDPEIRAPRLVGDGRLFDNDDAPWPYLVTTKMPGKPWRLAGLASHQKRVVIAELGDQVKRIQRLGPCGVVTPEHWQPEGVATANLRSSLAPHLVAQIDDFLATLGPLDRVFVHGDIVANHIFIEDGHLAGIIDWGDAMAIDRHYELIQPHRDMFDCDRELLRIFLETSDWPVGEDFARRALGLALHRQAVGLSQHHSIDVFEPVAQRFPLDDIATLDELADLLFAVEIAPPPRFLARHGARAEDTTGAG